MDELVAKDETVIRKALTVAETVLCSDVDAEGDDDTDSEELPELLVEKEGGTVSETVTEPEPESEGATVSDNEIFAELLREAAVDWVLDAPNEGEIVDEVLIDLEFLIVKDAVTETEITELGVIAADGEELGEAVSRLEKLELLDEEDVNDMTEEREGF